MSTSRLTLTSGRTIQLDSLEQSLVYVGLLEGLPTRKMNAGTIAHLVGETRERDGTEPLLIEPVQAAIAYEGRYPFGEPAKLPAVACVAAFSSTGKTYDYFSTLSVIWFQDEYAFPINATVLDSLIALEWDRVAAQHEI